MSCPSGKLSNTITLTLLLISTPETWKMTYASPTVLARPLSHVSSMSESLIQSLILSAESLVRRLVAAPVSAKATKIAAPPPLITDTSLTTQPYDLLSTSIATIPSWGAGVGGLPPGLPAGELLVHCLKQTCVT